VVAPVRWVGIGKNALGAPAQGLASITHDREVLTEPSDASATLLYDVPGERWDVEVIEALGLIGPSSPHSRQGWRRRLAI
jgi:hypothetical protein